MAKSKSSSPYYMLACYSPDEGDHAQYTYEPEDDDEYDREWITGTRFETPPAALEITVEPGEEGLLPELTDVPIPMMTRRLADCLTAAGVTNIDFYPVTVTEVESGDSHEDLVAFNLLGLIEAADFSKAVASAPDGPLLSVDFDGLGIDPTKTGGLDMFRLAESVNGIVVSKRLKDGILKAGIKTLEFMEPEDWVG